MSWSLAKIQIARYVQAASQHTITSPDDSSGTILEIDAHFERFLHELPSWWTSGNPETNMTSTYKISYPLMAR